MRREMRGEARVSEFELARCNLYLYAHLPLSFSPPFFPPPTFSLPFSHLSPFPLFSCAPIHGSYHVHLRFHWRAVQCGWSVLLPIYNPPHCSGHTGVQNREVDSALCGKDI